MNKQDIKYSAPGAHHQNGIAERHIRTISDLSRSMFIDAACRWPGKHLPFGHLLSCSPSTSGIMSHEEKEKPLLTNLVNTVRATLNIFILSDARYLYSTEPYKTIRRFPAGNLAAIEYSILDDLQITLIMLL